ncbi:MAG: methyltransferase, partial [Alphaproteobacteria bacterium]|nr:methyltransferase [Alphaproteobacteria bacterium]
MRFSKFAAATAVVIGVTAGFTAQADAPKADAALKDAVAGSWRTPTNVQRDQWRKPAEALSFWGLKPGMTVLE